MVISRLGKVLVLSTLSIFLFSTTASAQCRREETKLDRALRKRDKVAIQLDKIQAKVDAISFQYDNMRAAYQVRLQEAQEDCNAGFTSRCNTAQNIQERIFPRIEQKRQKSMAKIDQQRYRVEFKLSVLDSEAQYWQGAYDACMDAYNNPPPP